MGLRRLREMAALFLLTVQTWRIVNLTNDNERDLNQRETGGDSFPDSLGRITPSAEKNARSLGAGTRG
jgi:hypothetical protein